MLDWIIDNKEWVFSGFGVTIILGLINFMQKKSKGTYNQQSGSDSVNIQGIKANRNVKVEVGEKRGSRDV